MLPKFRAYVLETKEMMNVDIIDYLEGQVTHFNNYMRDSCEEEKTYWFDDVAILQSTGLKDINGKEIFEGDITKVHEFVDFGGVEGEKEIIGVIKYGRVYECPIKEWYLKTKYYYTPLACMNLHEESFEILGNKFEHPHLLGED
ncbi:YopX family protein [Mammaliicoccus sciuri]|uniref:YopX family protein n=1 Tax=Mammaliicoccus sciuri TaxID=1296 RepID=UPI002B2644A8|nr:YopX family protein [Mammaliicoccus sciuri]WQL18519.1 YopX family protein [Mammaliicoccus sciuri]